VVLVELAAGRGTGGMCLYWLPVPSRLIARLDTILRASVGNGTCDTTELMRTIYQSAACGRH